ncbi:S8 family serine peptidase [Leptospira selangorensis]|uniref:S8 family serine peptidase n=1 Tax=Leptospira selangorensis TaxID=2484982 RepID=UPI001FC8F875|nr:S8 family serine peptidase [Leptospira selangorensis]
MKKLIQFFKKNMKIQILIFILTLLFVGGLTAKGSDQNFLQKIKRQFESLAQTDSSSEGLKKRRFAKNQKFVQGEILVKFKGNTGESVKTFAANKLGGSLLESVHSNGLSRISVREGSSIEEAIQEYNNQPGVEFAQPNYVYHKTVKTPNDPGFNQLWGLKNSGQTIFSPSYSTSNPGTSGNDMNMQNAWDLQTDCTTTVVAVIDSGVNYNHEDLSSNMWSSASCVSDTGVSLGACSNGYDYADIDSDPMDLDGHGTHVAGTIAAKGDNNLGSSGVCWNAKIMAVRVLDEFGSGTTADIVKGINFALRNGAKVINLSLGGNTYDSSFANAITSAASGSPYEALFIVAAGNDGADLQGSSTSLYQQSYPCEFTHTNLLCVGALDQAYLVANFSNYDSNATSTNRSVDVGAPGTNIRSSWTGLEGYELTDFSTWTIYLSSGTSWAANNCTIGGSSYSMLLLPNDCATVMAGTSTSGYAANTTSYAYKTFSLASGTDLTKVSALIYLDTESYDKVYTSYRGDNLVPHPSQSPYGLGVYSGEMNGALGSVEYSLPLCTGSATACTFAFYFYSDSTISKAGVGVVLFELTTLDKDNLTQYKVIDGTSMATPHVAGVAALVRSYNPTLNSQDVIEAIGNGGKTTSSISAKTKYGTSVDAYGALKYLQAPTGITGAIQ